MAVLLYRLGTFAARRRRLVVLGWLLVPGTESERALGLLADEFPGTGGATARIVIAAPKGQTLEQPRFRELVDRTGGPPRRSLRR